MDIFINIKRILYNLLKHLFSSFVATGQVLGDDEYSYSVQMWLHHHLVMGEGHLASHSLPLQAAAIDLGHQAVQALLLRLLGIQLHVQSFWQFIALLPGGPDHVPVVEHPHHRHRGEAWFCHSS